MKKKNNKFDETCIHIGDAIRKELNKQKRSIAWLSNEIAHDVSNLHKQLNSPHIHSKWLYRISKALKKDFFALYSQKLSDEKHISNQEIF